jgi:hypothetical protein
VVTVPGYRLPGEENAYAVDFRPGSTVKSHVEGETIISEVTWTGWAETITTVACHGEGTTVCHELGTSSGRRSRAVC